MAVFCREVPGLVEAPLFPRQRAKRSVCHSRSLLVHVPLRLLDGLVDRRRIRDFVQQQNLIRAKAQNVQHRRLQARKSARHNLLQIMIQQHPVLHHAVGKRSCQRRVAPLEPVALHIFL